MTGSPTGGPVVSLGKQVVGIIKQIIKRLITMGNGGRPDPVSLLLAAYYLSALV